MLNIILLHIDDHKMIAMFVVYLLVQLLFPKDHQVIQMEINMEMHKKVTCDYMNIHLLIHFQTFFGTSIYHLKDQKNHISRKIFVIQRKNVKIKQNRHNKKNLCSTKKICQYQAKFTYHQKSL